MSSSLVQLNIRSFCRVASIIVFVFISMPVFFFGISTDELSDDFRRDIHKLIGNKEFDDAICSLTQEIHKASENEYIKKAQLFQLLAITYLMRGYVHEAEEKANLDKAEECYGKALETYRKKVSSDTPFTAATYNGLGSIYKRKKEFGKFRDYTEKAINILEGTADGKYNRDLVASITNLAKYYEAEGDFIKSEEWYKRALDVLNKDSSKVPIFLQADIYKAMGKIHINKSDFEASGRFYLKVLELYQNNFKKEFIPQMQYIRHQLSTIYLKTDELEKAIKLYEENIRMLEENYGENSLQVAREMQNLSGFYEKIGNYKEAGELRKRAGRIYDKHPLHLIYPLFKKKAQKKIDVYE